MPYVCSDLWLGSSAPGRRSRSARCSGGDVDHHTCRVAELQHSEPGSMLQPDAEPNNTFPVLGQYDLLHLRKGGSQLVRHRLGARPVVVAGGALEGCLDQRPALQRQVLVIALTKGDRPDRLAPVAWS